MGYVALGGKPPPPLLLAVDCARKLEWWRHPARLVWKDSNFFLFVRRWRRLQGQWRRIRGDEEHLFLRALRFIFQAGAVVRDVSQRCYWAKGMQVVGRGAGNLPNDWKAIFVHSIAKRNTNFWKASFRWVAYPRTLIRKVIRWRMWRA